MKTKLNFKKTVGALFLLLFFFYLISASLMYYYVFSAGNKLNHYTTREYVRFKIYNTSKGSNNPNNILSANISIIDSCGSEIAVIERSWNGNYLACEFREFDYKNKKYIFPFCIYSRNSITQKGSIKKITTFNKYYTNNGQCMLLGYNNSDKERRFLYWISQLACNKLPIFDFGHVKNIYIDLSACETGVYYSIINDGKDNLKLIRL